MINLSVPNTGPELKPRITVIGVGGAGGNAVNNMIQSHLEGVDFIVANTDAQALSHSRTDRRIQLGADITKGLGAGARPDVGRAAAEEAMQEIVNHITGSNMVFITAGMGGGTGTGAAPVIASAARELGVLTVGVVTKPFQFEGAHRMRMAEAGIEELQQYVDTLIIIPNQNLFRLATEKTTFADAFKMADDVLYAGVRGVTDLMVMPGLINLDFADIRTVMSEMGKAMMGTGEAEGEKRSIEAAEAAISNPLLEDTSMKGAKGVLINITGGYDMTLFEVDEAANRIRDEVDPDANIIFGSTFDEALNGRMRVSVVATGIESEAAQQHKPTLLSMLAAREQNEQQQQQPQRPTIVTSARPAGQTAKPGVAHPISVPASPALAAEVAEAAEIEGNDAAPAQPAQVETPAAVASVAAFIPPAPIQADNVQAATPAPRAAQPEVPEQRQPEPTPRLGLLDRLTGRGRIAAVPTPAPQRAEPQMTQPQQQRLGGLDPEDRPAQTPADEHLLDIPAFLRRQAN